MKVEVRWTILILLTVVFLTAVLAGSRISYQEISLSPSIDGLRLGMPASLVKVQCGTPDSAYGNFWYYRLGKASGSSTRIISFDRTECVSEIFGFELFDQERLLAKAGDPVTTLVENLAQYGIQGHGDEYTLQDNTYRIKIVVKRNRVVSFELTGLSGPSGRGVPSPLPREGRRNTPSYREPQGIGARS